MNAPRGGGGGGKASSASSAGASKTTTGNAKSSSGGRNRNNKRVKRRKQRKKDPKKARGPPQSPQIKLVFRNIGKPESYGTAEAIAGIMRAIVDRANERLTGPADKPVLMDEETLCRLIENDKVATKSILEWKKRQEEDEPKEEEQEAQNEDNGKGGNEEEEAALVTGLKGLELKEAKEGKIFARPLYIIPPKKTRRRGEKPGNAYLVLTAPHIEAIEPPPLVQEAPADEAAATAEEEANQTEEESAEVPPVPPKVDYSRQIAERQLAVVRALEVMSAIAKEDANGEQVWAGCQVEESSSGKTWRPPQRKDNREGTYEESPGFQAFLEMTAKEKEELQARPKPAPGGGLTALSSASLSNLAGATTGENGKPVAALVAHIQSRREQEKLQKKNKRKAKDAKKKAAAVAEAGETTPTNGKVETNNAKKKPRRRKKASGAKKTDPKS